MEIRDNTLNQIQTNIDNSIKMYLSEGRLDANECKNNLWDYKQELDKKIKFHESRASNIKNVNDSGRQNIISLALSGDIGLIQTFIKDEMKRGHYSTVLSLSDLIISSKSYSNSEKFQITTLKQDAENLSGFSKEMDLIGQSNVVRAELESYIENVGLMGASEVRSLASSKKFKAELDYLRSTGKERLT